MNTINISNFPQVFLKNFAYSISVDQLKKNNCYAPNHGYLWMICDHDLVENLKGEKAKDAFDSADKTGAVEFQYDNGFVGDEFALPLSTEHDKANKIDESGIVEFYVIGKDFSWCYIVTHERDACGPFFIKNNSFYN